ncbi:MAG: TolC family protein [Vicinamibacterales bacterium]
MSPRQFACLLAVALLCSRRANAQTSSQPAANPFLGSIPAGAVSAEPLALSVKDAVQRALHNNLGLLLQEEAESSARGARWRALADLLPDVSGTFGSRRQVINLEAYGFPAKPSIVGPFNVHDARVYLSQPVLDLSALNDARAAAFSLRAEKYGVRSARDLVVLVAVNLYLESVATGSRVEMARAQQATAEALFAQARDLKSAGIVAGIDVLRSQVQLQTQRQRVIAAENDFAKAKLQLARAIGLPLGQAFNLTDKMPYAPMPAPSLEEVLARALDERPDFLAAKSRVDAARAASRAATSALLPSLRFDADYGAIGQSYNAVHGTYSLAAIVRIPLFDAGKTTARRIETGSVVRQREAELADIRGRVEFEVRSALLDLRAADQQLEASNTNVELAQAELTQARDRFGAGIASNLESTQAQESVATASEQYITALYSHNLAKASLARALGIAESAVANYLGGVR